MQYHKKGTYHLFVYWISIKFQDVYRSYFYYLYFKIVWFSRLMHRFLIFYEVWTWFVVFLCRRNGDVLMVKLWICLYEDAIAYCYSTSRSLSSILLLSFGNSLAQHPRWSLTSWILLSWQNSFKEHWICIEAGKFRLY